MCQITHYNFYHNCGHRQTIVKPNTNPACDYDGSTFYYIQDGDQHNNDGGGWCDRCFFGKWRMNMEYEVAISAPRCRITPRDSPSQLEAATREWTEQVSWGPIPWVNYNLDDLWQQRRDAATDWSDYQTELARKANIILTREEDLNEFPPVERTYFLDTRPLERRPVEDLYFRKERGQIGAFEGTCAICRGDYFVDVEEGGCDGAYPVSLPCQHVFGIDCIRRHIEGEDIHEDVYIEGIDVDPEEKDKCPTCKVKLKIVRAMAVYPDNFQKGHAEYILHMYQREHLLKWHEQPLRHWQLRTALFALAVLLAGTVFEPPPWTSWWTIMVFFLGTACYYQALTVPIVQWTGWKALLGIWLGYAWRVLRREFFEEGRETDWISVVLVVVGFLLIWTWTRWGRWMWKVVDGILVVRGQMVRMWIGVVVVESEQSEGEVEKVLDEVVAVKGEEEGEEESLIEAVVLGGEEEELLDGPAADWSSEERVYDDSIEGSLDEAVAALDEAAEEELLDRTVLVESEEDLLDGDNAVVIDGIAYVHAVGR